MSERAKPNKTEQFEKFKRDAGSRGVYLIYERKYIYPGDSMPTEYGPSLVPHYRYLNRDERRQNPNRK